MTHKSVYYLSQKCVIYLNYLKHLLFSVYKGVVQISQEMCPDLNQGNKYRNL